MPSTYCQCSFQLDSKNVTAEKLITVSAIGETRLPSKNMRNIENSSKTLSLIEFGTDNSNQIGALETFFGRRSNIFVSF